MKKLILALAVLAFSGCGGGGSGPAAPATTTTTETTTTTTTTQATTAGKNLFSSWAEVSPADGFVFDMTNFGFGENAMVFLLKAGGGCACLLSIGGTQSAGSFALTSCVFGAQGTSNADPGCSTLDGNDTYTNSGTQLTLCRVGSTTCSTWQ